jgi:hypothetical protein
LTKRAVYESISLTKRHEFIRNKRRAMSSEGCAASSQVQQPTVLVLQSVCYSVLIHRGERCSVSSSKCVVFYTYSAQCVVFYTYVKLCGSVKVCGVCTCSSSVWSSMLILQRVRYYVLILQSVGTSVLILQSVCSFVLILQSVWSSVLIL